MDEERIAVAPSGTTRRALLAGSLGLMAGALSRQASAAALDSPPPFETGRRQYTILEPARRMKGVVLSSLSGVPKLVSPAPGKVTLVSFWATWCINCKTDLPALAELQRVMGKRIQVEAVSTDKADRQVVNSFVSELGIRGLSISLDPNGLFGELDGGGNGDGQFPAYGLPITYLVTPDGVIAGYIIDTADWLSDAGQALLAYYR